MLPEADDLPPGAAQAPHVAPIARPVPPELGLPEGGVALRPRAMPRTAVPEATIDEDGDTVPHESYVDRPVGPLDSAVKAVSVTANPEFAAQA